MGESSFTPINRMEIDLSALENNYKAVKSRLEPGTRIIASVKGAAYGLGFKKISKHLVKLGADALTTGSFEDARSLRDEGLDTDIVMFAGALPDAMPAYIQHSLIPTVHSRELAEAVSAASPTTSKVYVKVDCGLGRLGVPLSSAVDFVLSVARLPRVEVEGIYTHLPFSDEGGLEWARRQSAKFDALLGDLKRAGFEAPITQSRSSSGILADLKDACNAVAPGGALYGKIPLSAQFAGAGALQPVLKSVKSRLIHIAAVEPSTVQNVYSARAQPRVGPIGVIPFGRTEGNRAPATGQTAYVLLRGVKAPVLMVTTEHTVVDLSDVPGPVLGEDVVILGESGTEAIRLEDLARWQSTTTSDILLTMNGRMPLLFASWSDVQSACPGTRSSRDTSSSQLL